MTPVLLTVWLHFADCVTPLTVFLAGWMLTSKTSAKNKQLFNHEQIWECHIYHWKQLPISIKSLKIIVIFSNHVIRNWGFPFLYTNDYVWYCAISHSVQEYTSPVLYTVLVDFQNDVTNLATGLNNEVMKFTLAVFDKFTVIRWSFNEVIYGSSKTTSPVKQ